MPRLSEKKLQKIKEEILYILFNNSPKALFTCEVAEELIRDEEFTKQLLENLHQEKLIVKITKNPEGYDYTKRAKWQLSNGTYEAYKNLSN